MRKLVIKLGTLSDVVIAMSLIQRMGAHCPGGKLTSLTTPAFISWLWLYVVTIPRKCLHNMWRALRWVRAQCFGRVFDLQSNDHSAILATPSSVRMRVSSQPDFTYMRRPTMVCRSEIHIPECTTQVLVSWYKHRAVGWRRMLRQSVPCSLYSLGECLPNNRRVRLQDISVNDVLERLYDERLLSTLPGQQVTVVGGRRFTAGSVGEQGHECMQMVRLSAGCTLVAMRLDAIRARCLARPA